ncbi:DNA-directed RNA polymerase II protein isoform 1 [Hibiscus syriacus]|uniref:DNA-directed RNA polymerase II protein isoform 1 n=1 Tax=Hibiscus syriacus TaxID=106335 RepID=A0A6A3AB95_HIBSY|nr:DNA-directed RNA polymerase II protein isoform 1 [Hibiscus syriacus]
MELACLSFQTSSLFPVRLKSSKATSHVFSLASLPSGKSSNSSRIRCLSSKFSSCPALGVNRVRRRQQFSLSAVVGDKTAASDNCDEKKVSGPDSADSLSINDEVTREGESESDEGSVEWLDINKMTRVCDKLIEVFLVDKPTPTDWRRLLAFSKEWNNIRPHFFQRCQDRAELEGDPGSSTWKEIKRDICAILNNRDMSEAYCSYFQNGADVLAIPFIQIDEDVQRHNELLEVIKGAPLEINEIVAKRRKDFTKEFFVHIHTVAESYYDNPTEQNAELKFQDIINSPSLDVACREIDSLAEKNQLDSALVLMITKAWSAAKESNMTKDEVKDILYHLYTTARGNLQRLLPKEIRIVKYLLTIEDPEERLCALNDAFTPGEELEGMDVDNLFTTHDESCGGCL